MSNNLLDYEDRSGPFMLQKFSTLKREMTNNTTKCFDACQSNAQVENLLISNI